MLPICYHKEYIIIAYYYNTTEYVFHFDKSLIPLPSFETRETDQIKLQAMRFVVTLKTLRATVILTNGTRWHVAITTSTFPYFR